MTSSLSASASAVGVSELQYITDRAYQNAQRLDVYLHCDHLNHLGARERQALKAFMKTHKEHVTNALVKMQETHSQWLALSRLSPPENSPELLEHERKKFEALESLASLQMSLEMKSDEVAALVAKRLWG